MSVMKTVSVSHIEKIPGKLNQEKYLPFTHRFKLSKLTLLSSIFLAFILFFFFLLSSSPSATSTSRRNSWGGPDWEKRVTKSARKNSPSSFTVLVTRAAGFVGMHVSLALKHRGDSVLGLDNFNRYYDPNLKRARQKLLTHAGIFIVEGDINDSILLHKLFDVVPFSHVIHLAAQAGVRYAMQNRNSYVHSNIAGFVNLLEACKSANPQPSKKKVSIAHNAVWH